MIDDDPGEAATLAAPETPTRGTVGASAAGTSRDSMLEIGERFGDRYVVHAFLGEGGMGAVYRALDERLGVDVALKLVRDAARVEEVRDEVRLAQKVTHPNVCRTYDLEEVDGRAFIKMEVVAGETVARTISKHGPLPIADAIRVARAILAGLRAAHAVGVIHRDLKLSNVMLSGERVVLMDFGVARLEADAKGATAGTLGYMAPEQIANLPIDGRADLYALGCVLYAMLAGEAVFSAQSPLQLGISHVSMPAPDVRAKRADTPRWLARAVARLLAKEPAPRELGARALETGPVSVRRFALPAAAIVLAGVGAAMVVHSRHSGSEACTGIDHRLVGVWDAPARTAAHDAFIKTKVPYAEKSFTALARSLDGYSALWTTAVTESCRATRVRGEQSEDVFALREECLDNVLVELRAFVKQLDDADAALVNRGEAMVGELDPAARCANIAALRAPGQPPRDIEPRVKQLSAELLDAQAALVAGRILPTLVGTKRVLDAAQELHWDPLLADAYRTRGTALLGAGNIDEARQNLEQAAWTAMRGHRDDLLAASALGVAFIVADKQGKPGEAQIWVDLGGAASDRYGDDPKLQQTRYQFASVVAASRGDFKTAIVLNDKALASLKASGVSNGAVVAALEINLGATLAKAGACGEAIPHYEHALDLVIADRGEVDVDVTRTLSNLGLCYRHVGDLDKARDTLARALVIREQLFGKTSPLLVAPLDNYAELLSDRGDHEAAIAMVERALSLATVIPGPTHPDFHQLLTDEGDIYASAHRLADAHRVYAQALDLEHQTSSIVLPKTQTALANLALAEEKWADAEKLAGEAIADFEAQGGNDQPELWRPLTSLARAKLARKDSAAARAAIERALSIAVKAHVPDHDLQPTRALAAQMGS